jgi:hypothetical protein
VVGYFEYGFTKTIKRINATEQMIPTHHGLNGTGNKTTITHHHRDKIDFVVFSIHPRANADFESFVRNY